MKNTDQLVVGRADVGEQRPSPLSEKHTIVVAFHDFPSLPRERWDKTASPPLLCHGYLWSVEVYPGGSGSSDDGYISMYLRLMNSAPDEVADPDIKYMFRLSGMNRKARSYKFSSSSVKFCGYKNFVRRADVLDTVENSFLVKGVLTVEVDIQLYVRAPVTWIPRNKLQMHMIRMLEEADNADITFAVGQDKFPVHRLILGARAPVLAALAEDVPANEVIPISHIRPHIFRMLLRFVYANEIPPAGQLNENARELLESADRFGCSDLKLIAESALSKSDIEADNAADLILYADAKCCPLLKEAAVDFFAAHPAQVMASRGWSRLKESGVIMAELMEILVGRRKLATGDSSSEDVGRMRVASLRRKLEDKGLDADGSREMLVKRLKTSSASDRS